MGALAPMHLQIRIGKQRDYKTLAGFAFLWKSKENKLSARQETPDAKRRPASTGAGKENRTPMEETATHGWGVRGDGSMCALCSEPGSTGGLVIDTDDLRKKVRGLVHPKCKAFLALGRDNPLRFQMAITYLGQNVP